jgi:hypothetical protein
MHDYWQGWRLAIRRWPLYAGLVGAVLAGFVGTNLAGYRLLGDDNETDANELVGPPRAGGHGGAARFYHK